MLKRWLIALTLVLSFAIPIQAEVPTIIRRIVKANRNAWKKHGLQGCKYAVAASISEANIYLLQYRAPQYFTTKEEDGWGHVFLVVKYEGQDWIIDHIAESYLNKRGQQDVRYVEITAPVPNFEDLGLEEVKALIQRPLYF